jgi:hypothetical protein
LTTKNVFIVQTELGGGVGVLEYFIIGLHKEGLKKKKVRVQDRNSNSECRHELSVSSSTEWAAG